MVQLLLWLLYAAVLYTTIFSLIVLFDEGKLKQDVEWLDEWPAITLIIPAYNEEDSIAMTIESAMAVNYPEDKLEIIVVDDGSEDETAEIARRYTEDDRVRLIQQENQGKGGALNTGIDATDSKFVACVDADSRIEEDSVKHIVSEFDEDTAAVASAMKVYQPKNWLQQIQAVEYIVGIFMRNIMGVIDAIHVTPGPLSVYKREVIEDVGGFDPDSLVEDQEICFRLQKHHWRVAHSRHGEVYTLAPDNLRDYYKQRKRWYRGSFENLIQYREMILNTEYGDFGTFALPSKVVSSFLSIAAFTLILYLTGKPILEFIQDFLILGVDIFDFSDSAFSLETVSSAIYWMILNTKYVTTVLLSSLFFLSVMLAYLASIHTEEDLREYDLIPVLFYLAYYVVFIGAVWLVAVVEVALDYERRW
ncbi:MAG: glycosyltransferase family 2 protein [Candidatus Nanosalina sp.]